MSKRKALTLRQEEKIEKERSMQVYKADDLLQKARFTLSITEQRLILYAVSKIKPTDNAFQSYIFDLKDFMQICGTNNHDSYTTIKQTCRKLSDKSWWLLMEDPNAPGTDCESLVRWFSTLRTNKGRGTVTIKFHDDMFPYLLELSKQLDEGTAFYTRYELSCILPMKSQYSIRLYELLKSYQKNNREWWFKLDKLKHILDCDSYTRFPDFRRYVLDTAIKEINEFTDLKIEYETEKSGKKIDVITFYMIEKSTKERIKAQQAGLTALDGEVHYWDIPGQLSFEDTEKENP